MSNFNRNAVVKAILKGAKYLFGTINYDGGVKFEDESSITSGAWVTAETLEALLSSAVLPLPAYNKIEPMIEFLIHSQNDDGSWNVLIEKNGAKKPSSISTGHCIYALKLAMVGGYLNTTNIKQAVEKGEQWLRSGMCCIEKNGYVFWAAEPIVDFSSIDPNADVRSRMGYVFSSFYAVMGLINPSGYKVINDMDGNLLDKSMRFFRKQAEFFAEMYKSKSEIDKLDDDILQFSKVSSTICRIINAIDILNIEIASNLRDSLHEVLLLCAKNPFMTTSITVHTNKLQGYTATYNNNTPFDMANAFLSVGADLEILDLIVSQYIRSQNTEGSWFLNFSSAYTIKTWTTAEAIIVLNRVLERYVDIEIHENKKSAEKKCQDLETKYNKLKYNSMLTAVISFILSSVDIVAIIIWISNPEHKDSFLGNFLTILIIPLVLWTIGKLWEIIKSTIEIIKNKK